MNTKILIALFPIVLSGCNFNEDDCIRNGELVAWCDYSNIKEGTKIPEQRYLLPFGSSVPPSAKNQFTSDTLHWELPQGNYDFIYANYADDIYHIVNPEQYQECRLQVRTDTIEEQCHINNTQGFCSTSIFNERLVYQQKNYVRITPSAFVQRLNVKINVTGNTAPIEALKGSLEGVCTEKYLQSRKRQGVATAHTAFIKKGNEDVWITSMYLFGANPLYENLFTIQTAMNEENTAYNETQSVDLTQYLRGFEGEEISLELNLTIGKELEISEPVIIPDWEDGDETELLTINKILKK